jgi:hypothetical protein
MNHLKVLPVLLAVTFNSAFYCNAQKVKGNKNITTQERKVSPFTQLEISGVGDVTIKQGEKEIVSITTDENIQQYIETVNDGNKLTVGTNLSGQDNKHTSISSTELKIEITVKDINSLLISGTGNVKTTGLNISNLVCRSSGTGNLDFDFTCTKLTLKVSGAGNVSLKGKAEDAVISMSGAGNLKAFDFAAKKLSANMSGMGNAELNAEAELSIDASGMGNVTYMGNAAVKKIETSGTGRVKKM